VISRIRRLTLDDASVDRDQPAGAGGAGHGLVEVLVSVAADILAA
jgi:hypothetical protein